MELLIQELRLQRDAQLRHFEALATRAGIVLGFAGAIAAFSPLGGLLGTAGRFLAIASAVLCLASFIPRGFPVLDAPSMLRSGRDERGPLREEHYLKWLGWSSERASDVLRLKSRALAWAVVSMVLATLILGSAIIASGG